MKRRFPLVGLLLTAAVLAAEPSAWQTEAIRAEASPTFRFEPEGGPDHRWRLDHRI
jgi:hypothetical protein